MKRKRMVSSTRWLALAVATELTVATSIGAFAADTPPPSSAPAAPAASTGGLVIDRIEWSGSAAPAKVVTIENDYGDVRVRTSKDSSVAVTTVVQRLDSAGEKLTLAVERAGSALVVRVEYPPLATADPDNRAKRERRDRADLVIFVPKDVPVDARTRFGVIEAAELENDIDAVTDAGQMRISCERSVRARTTSGALHLLLLEPEWDRTMLVETETGDIDVELPRHANLDVKLATGGKIESSYPAARASDDSFTIGKGGTALVVQSRTGRIQLTETEHEPE